MATTIFVRPIKNDFARGLKYARMMEGVYDPSSKTWEIPADRPELGNLKAYGLELVPQTTIDQGDHMTDDTMTIADALSEAMNDEHSIL